MTRDERGELLELRATVDRLADHVVSALGTLDAAFVPRREMEALWGRVQQGDAGVQRQLTLITHDLDAMRGEVASLRDLVKGWGRVVAILAPLLTAGLGALLKSLGWA